LITTLTLVTVSNLESVADRIVKPHLSDASFTNIYHPPELNLVAWPFPNWYLYKQSPWMMLSRSAIVHLNQNTQVLNFLAMTEHTAFPDEYFFATVLANSAIMSSKIKQDKKRYVKQRTSTGETDWIGWEDRHLFPTGSSDPSYLFLSPLNVLGDFFGETNLLEWIKENHLTVNKGSLCYKDQIGYRPECLRETLSLIAEGKSIILVPIDSKFLDIAENLRCSLKLIGISNIVFWALDVKAHEYLTSKNYFSYFISGFSK
jgi:hypothetical protein